ncbi:MAG: hypothetical protein A2821_02720 [Candidatus Magasanikbacteria bacterium RIFCSPHIGHO2_01_FULL_41_23]|uniref:GIY-YIG domain-containing protein n=1 Tax=Candidatus Magasanikbacteria bacterium RIFCSPLOWO2_01_FULL_40_15 TaxID=1798686 RepID=A0A1F6N1R8_9BACT|nr:MAG: hypothetical protein A2821_02720 [Candidatus Magasanikbacteria bacterium RIFCSPHIGHO2_01_FULL_41_23]OGH67254.1 MAG: hypothetical protein A3C66_00740 [Candidatus Magasanikbacteria bacterium RIFCSPHIGHO2_02_FULL_41_35]OGH74799.1 MAG: hypothetical protein A3F22_04790 [Candidatus Magasanikbacteria bacterium RIFCSPHIGHO2_12_FULL_41_16]OGH77821.1 MAG: hypothetical protein A2983_00290 [Candidatus Magasanikbacteria bacterium RIFCSPLOWO2_01_FULL_40_15]
MKNGGKFYLYIACCKDGSLYTGITNDLVKREKQHNEGIGSKYTASRRPIKLVYNEIYPTRSAASKREAQIKGWVRTKKEKLIKGTLFKND